MFYLMGKSYIQDVTCGAPQGSILGPLLFILYINDFLGVSDKLLCILFADDTNIFLICKLTLNISFHRVPHNQTFKNPIK